MIYPQHRTKILITSKKKKLLGVLYVRWLKCNMERRVEKKVQMTWENNKFSIKYFTVRICFGEPVFSSCQVVGAWGIDVECLLQSYRAKDARLIFFVMLLAETLITLKQLSVYECIYVFLCMCVFMHFHCWLLPLSKSLPLDHNASRFAPSKNHLQTEELCKLEKATDVSLGFLHST